MDKNIMKLYYPYGICVVSGKKEFFEVICLKTNTYEVTNRCGEKYEISYDSKKYKPVLYPLESIGKVRKINGKEIIPLEVISQTIYEYIKALNPGSEEEWVHRSVVNYFNNVVNCPFSWEVMNYIYYILHTFHFDLSDSIRKREAKNVYRLHKDPYENEIE